MSPSAKRQSVSAFSSRFLVGRCLTTPPPPHPYVPSPTRLSRWSFRVEHIKGVKVGAEDTCLCSIISISHARYAAEPQGCQKYRKGTLAAMATQQIALMCLIYKPMKGRKAKNIEGTAHERNPTRGGLR